jgi:AraC family transcriptional regulator of adaptative response / DNA-3-methyladenine glycosylase II
VRQFNHAFRRSFARAPRDVRRGAPGLAAPGEGIALRLRYRPPYDWDGVLGFLASRAIPGVESVTGGTYRRTIALGEDGADAGWLEVAPLPAESALTLRVSGPERADLLGVVERVRRIFDLRADPLAIAATLGALAARRPGLRVPGAWDAFELGVRAILGQQVSVAGASTLAGRIARAFGKPVAGEHGLTHLFPTAAALARAELASIGLPRARAAAIRGFAEAVASGALELDGARSLDDAVARLSTLPGVGPWTAQYVAMRALGEPDAFPASDLWLRRALGENGRPVSAARAEALAERWRPWRSYAALALWSRLADAGA